MPMSSRTIETGARTWRSRNSAARASRSVGAQEVARAGGMLGLVSEQSLYNLMSRTAEHEVLPACQYYGLGVIPWSPLNRGVLGGILKSSSTGRRGNDEAREIVAGHHDQLKQWEDFCAEFGAEPAEIAIAWLLHQQADTAPIVGSGALAHHVPAFH